MAQRRMIDRRFTRTQRFLRLPLETQALYFHLMQDADDDGIVEAFPIIRMIGASEDSLGLLEVKGFIRPLNDEMVYFILNFAEQNYIRGDRYNPSKYKGLLPTATIGQPNDNQPSTNRQPMVDPDKTRVDKTRVDKTRVDKNRIDKFSLDEDREEDSHPHENQLQNLADFIQNEFGTITPSQTEELRKLLFEDKFNIDVIKLAVTEASLSNKRSINYVKGILRNWKAEGIETVNAIEKRKSEKFAQPKAPRTDFSIPMDGPWNGK